ncbi:acetyl esterase/lipase [Kineosphaera limosa]|uniref:Peptidase S9 prolyl oligopeptidase catalytic domain-containing protein n=1 Tax=Kineosphaera limosa NBRC 100340 TaxID=1184609 RepID=K6WQE4_9MICO|nr:hypothetical protein [Kineosphaera limosa]NYE02422.1 acetyl esterase/lipase [Kineosphaera limosa]GAB96051.1 hypothetical protein KILIM_031_00230 [Kineosphaera limosa NBRC 100340]
MSMVGMETEARREDAALERLVNQAGPPGRTVSYGPEADQCVELFDALTDAGAAARDGWLVVVHGGFFRPTIDRVHTRAQARALALSGYSVVLAEYRREPGHPEKSLDDLVALDAALPQLLTDHTAARAADHTAARADRQPLDAGAAPRVAGWVGHSAGGALVLWRALTADLPPVRAVALAPLSNLTEALRRGLGDGAVRTWLGGAPASPTSAEAAAPEHIDPAALAAHAGPERLADILIVHGIDDASVPADLVEGTAMAGAVRLFPAAHHVDLIDPQSRWWPTMLASIDAHLRG